MMVFYLQGVLGFSPITAGILLIPTSVAISVLGPLSGWLSDRYGARLFASSGAIVNGVAFLLLTQEPGKLNYLLFFVPLVLLGAGFGLFSSPNRSETLSSVPPSRRGVAGGTNSTMMNVGTLLSLGVSIVIIAASVPHSVIVSVFDGVQPPPGSSSGFTIGSFMSGLHNVYYISAALSFAAVFVTLIGYKQAKEHRYELMVESEPEEVV